MKNKEIEELLNELKDVAKRHTIEVREYGVVETIPQSISKELRLNSYSANLLLSHIEQLEKDNKDLDKENQILFERNLQLENNRDKVIRTLESLKGSARWGRHLYEIDYMLDMLKGDSE